MRGDEFTSGHVRSRPVEEVTGFVNSVTSTGQWYLRRISFVDWRQHNLNATRMWTKFVQRRQAREPETSSSDAPVSVPHGKREMRDLSAVHRSDNAEQGAEVEHCIDISASDSEGEGEVGRQDNASAVESESSTSSDDEEDAAVRDEDDEEEADGEANAGQSQSPSGKSAPRWMTNPCQAKTRLRCSMLRCQCCSHAKNDAAWQCKLSTSAPNAFDLDFQLFIKRRFIESAAKQVGKKPKRSVTEQQRTKVSAAKNQPAAAVEGSNTSQSQLVQPKRNIAPFACLPFPSSLRGKFWFSFDQDVAQPKRWTLRHFCTKPVFIWRPDVQFEDAVSILCSKCKKAGSWLFDDWSKPRYIHCWDRGCYLISARYRCPSCPKRTVTRLSAASSEFMRQLPAHQALSFPFCLSHKGGMQRSLVSWLFTLWTDGVRLSTLTDSVARTRTTHYHRLRLLYMEALDFRRVRPTPPPGDGSNTSNISSGSDQSMSTSSSATDHKMSRTKPTSEDIRSHCSAQGPQSASTDGLLFPIFTDHCGYNEVLCPAQKFLKAVLFEYARETNSVQIAHRHMAAVPVVAACSDQTFKVPRGVTMFDPSTRSQAKPVPSLMATCNERGQCVCYYYTFANTNKELAPAAEQMHLRHGDTIKMWTTDRCCTAVRAEHV
jgi:hypothetical protein